MKKLFAIASLTCLSLSSVYADGATLYKKCASCHGVKADKVYLNKVPALSSLNQEERLSYIKEYAQGKRNAYGNGKIMQLSLKGLSDADFETINSYIESLK